MTLEQRFEAWWGSDDKDDDYFNRVFKKLAQRAFLAGYAQGQAGMKEAAAKVAGKHGDQGVGYPDTTSVIRAYDLGRDEAAAAIVVSRTR